MIELREATQQDRDAILALRKRCFPNEDVEKQEPSYWQWEFGNGRMFVAEEGGRAVAHLGFVPQTWRIDGESYEGMLAVDAMTDPDHRRQGIFNRVAAFARDALKTSVALSTAFQIRDAVLPPMEANGWRTVLRAPVLVKVNVGRAFARPIELPELRGAIAEEFLTRVAHVQRSDAQVRWRFVDNPLYRIDATDDAYVVSRRTTLRGYDTLAITDIAWRPGKTRDARVLLAEVLARGRSEGVRLAAALVSLSHPAMPALVRSGFLPSPHRFRFLVNAFDERIRVSRARWALTWADTDHL
ncbi:MAG TPA: GNAT family N-acetyltransferase [Thermoanaerobaculia bacterium]|nr:GNAT family N-acetyltransferase [Thermoanaerobaculia bacterium]